MMMLHRYIAMAIAVAWPLAIAADDVEKMEATKAPTIKLREEAFVGGGKILLRDIADISGENAKELADVEIVSAAIPGSSRTIDAALVASRVKDAGYDGLQLDPKGARAVSATTLHIEISKDAVAEDLRRFIQVNMPWDPAETIVDVLPPAYDVVVPDGDVTFDWKPNPQYKYLGNTGFRGEIYVDGALQKTVLCRASVEAFQEVVVATGNIPSGSTITPSSVALEKRPMTKLEGGSYTSLDEVMGLIARSTVFQGSVVTRQKVVPPKIIQRNQIVNVEARHGSVIVRTRAKAMDAGAVGDAIPLHDTATKTKYTGIVRADGVVAVE